MVHLSPRPSLSTLSLAPCEAIILRAMGEVVAQNQIRCLLRSHFVPLRFCFVRDYVGDEIKLIVCFGRQNQSGF